MLAYKRTAVIYHKSVEGRLTVLMHTGILPRSSEYHSMASFHLYCNVVSGELETAAAKEYGLARFLTAESTRSWWYASSVWIIWSALTYTWLCKCVAP